MLDDKRAHDAINREANRVRAAAQGERNNTLNAAAYTLGGVLPPEMVGEGFRALVTAAVDAGLTEGEARKTTAGALRDGGAAPLADTPPPRAFSRARAQPTREQLPPAPPRIPPPAGGAVEPMRVEGTRWVRLNEPARGERDAWSLTELVAWFRDPLPATPKEQLPVWHAATYRDNYRDGKHLERVSALVIDLDDWPDVDEIDLSRACAGYAYIAHTTASHAPGAARWRVVLPLAEPIDAATWRTNSKAIEAWITLRFAAVRDGGLATWSTDKREQKHASGVDVLPPEQVFYVPTNGEHFRVVFDLDVPTLPLLAAVEAELPRQRWEAQRARIVADSPVLRRFVQVADKGWTRDLPPPRAWLLTTQGEDPAGVLPLGKVGLLAAEGGAGKTMALSQLAVAVAAGGVDWLGWKIRNEGHVALLLGEEDEGEAHRRIYRAAEALDLDGHAKRRAEGRLTVAPLAGTLCAWTRKGQDGQTVTTDVGEDVLGELRALAEERGEGWALIVVDPLSRFAGDDAEQDAAAATRFVQVVERLTQLPGVVDGCGPTVLVAHHTNKASRAANRGGVGTDATAARGSSALTDGVRWQAQIDHVYEGGLPVHGFAVLHVTKSNYAARPEPVALARGRGGVLREMSGADTLELDLARKQLQAAASKKKAERAQLDKDARRGAANAATKAALP